MTAQTTRSHPFTKPLLPRAWRKSRSPQSPTDAQLDELRREADIANHLTEVQNLLAKHQLTLTNQPKLYSLLDQIAMHEREQRLFLGVVGEFSSGKTTLLNALLRDDLLLSDILQGTTAAATVLSYGPKLHVGVRRLPTHPVIRSFLAIWGAFKFSAEVISRLRSGQERDKDYWRDVIRQYSTIEHNARRIAQVNICHPAECLQNGMVIVDLPGTNAQNPRHGQVTAAALAEFCDAALIVVPSIAAGSETLWTFLRDHIEPDVLRRCVFVLNKIDLVRTREREGLIENMKARLRRDLGIDNPRVVAAAPERVLEAEGIIPIADDVDLAPTPDERAAWSTAFQQTESLLWATLREQKLLLQVERLARLLIQTFNLLSAVLAQRDLEYRDRHAALEQGLAQIPDLNAFVKQARDKHCGAYREAVKPVWEKCRCQLANAKESAQRETRNAVFGAKSKLHLKEVMKTTIPKIISKTQNDLKEILHQSVADLELTAERKRRQFHDHFQNLYRNLATLGGRLRSKSHRLESKAAESFTAGQATKSLANDAGRVVTGETLKVTGGAIAGTVIGTILFPGVGTWIGTAVGVWWSMKFGRSLLELQQEYWSTLEPAILQGFEEFDQQAQLAFVQAAKGIEDQLQQLIEDYVWQYSQLVDVTIAQDKMKAAKLNEFRAAIQIDLAAIADRQKQLELTRERLRNH